MERIAHYAVIELGVRLPCLERQLWLTLGVVPDILFLCRIFVPVYQSDIRYSELGSCCNTCGM